MIYGYARVSTTDQNLARQMKQLEEAGCQRIYHEKVTGAHTNRPQLRAMMDELAPGDIVIVSDLTRISRSTTDLFSLVEEIKAKGAALKSVKEPWLDTTSDNPYASFLLTVMAGVSQLERDLIKQRQAEGVALAKAQGKYPGRVKKYTEKHAGLTHAIELYREGKKVKDICTITKIGRSTLYRELAERGIER